MERMNLNLHGQSAQSFDPMAHAKMKVDTINNTPGNLTGYNCPKCLNRGNIAVLRDDGSFFTKDCDCMKIRRCIWEMERSGLKTIIQEKTFDTFSADETWRKTIKVGAMAYAENPDGWLLFCGQSGGGKTHLCSAVCRHRLMVGDEVRYMSWRDKIPEIKAMSLDNDQRTKIINSFKTAEILYIDDLYKGGKAGDTSSNPTRADVSLAFEIINHRYINHLPTIISTEKTPQELVDIDEATGGRIVEMAQEHTYCIEKKPGRNYRLRGVVNV